MQIIRSLKMSKIKWCHVYALRLYLYLSRPDLLSMMPVVRIKMKFLPITALALLRWLLLCEYTLVSNDCVLCGNEGNFVSVWVRTMAQVITSRVGEMNGSRHVTINEDGWVYRCLHFIIIANMIHGERRRHEANGQFSFPSNEECLIHSWVS